MAYRDFTKTLLGGAACLTALALAAPAQAQGTTDRGLELFRAAHSAFNRTIYLASEARIAGDCKLQKELLESAQRQAIRLEEADQAIFADGDFKDANHWRNQVREAKALTCPLPTIEFGERPVQIPATPITPPPPPDPFQKDLDAITQQQAYLDLINGLLIDMENYRVAGDCRRLSEDDFYITGLLHLFPPDTRADIVRRRNEILDRKCERNPYVDWYGGYTSEGVPLTNYGFERDSPTSAERPALRSKNHIPMITVGGSVFFPNLGSFSAEYREGDAQNFVELPAGPAGTARGFPYGAESPSGSTGIAGNVPMTVASEVAVQEFHAGFRRSAFPDFKPKDPFDLFYGIEGVIRDRDHRGEVSITTPVIANQLLEQDVDERELHLLVGAKAEVPLGNIARFLIGAEVSGYYYDFDLKSL